MTKSMMSRIPANVTAVLDLIRNLSSFTGWDGKTMLTIGDIKTYCVPGNDSRAKGRTAIWVKSPKAKRPRILFPEVVLMAMRFIADPQARGKFDSLHPSNFMMTLSNSETPESHLPGLHQNESIYVALARRLLGLPDDYQDEVTLRRRAELEEQKQASRPNIRSIDGLMQDTLLAFVDAMIECDESNDHHNWPEIAYRALWRRHRRSSWYGQESVLKDHLQGTYEEVLSDQEHEDIRSIELAVFATLYTNGLALTGAIRRSAVTTVVNHLADAVDDGVFAGLPDRIEQLHEEQRRHDEELGAELEAQLRRLVNRRR